MSAIGDYIHLTRMGYQNPQPKGQGVKPFGYTNVMIKESDSLTVFEQQREKMQRLASQRGSKEVAKKIQKQIREFQGVEGDSTKARLFYGYLLKAIEDDLEIVLRDNLKAAPQAGSSGSELTTIKRALDNIKAVDSKGRKGGVKFEQTLMPFYREVIKLYLSLQQGLLNLKTINNLNKQKKDLENYIVGFIEAMNEIKGSGRKIFQIKTIQNGEWQEPEKIITASNGTTISMWDFAMLIDELVKKLNYINAEKQGLAAEIVAAAASATSRTLAQQTIDKAFVNEVKRQSVIGNKKGQVYFDVSDFAESMYTGIEKGYSFDEKSGIMISDLASSDKVDVKFYLNEDEANPLNLSIKNYLRQTVIDRGFGGVSSAPFLNLVNQMNNNDFINHWINATIWHGEDFEHNLYNEMRGKYWKTAHTIMKYSLVVFSMVKSGKKIYNGQVGESDTADYLVWNNASGSKTQGMVVYPMSELLKNIYLQIAINEDNKSWVEGYDEKFMSPDEWSTVKMFKIAKANYRKTVPQIRKRISLALIKMFQAKISTHLFLSNDLMSRMET